MLFLCTLRLFAEDTPLHAWRFNAAPADGATVKPLAGPQSAVVIDTHEFQPGPPPCLKLSGKQSRVELGLNTSAGLPEKNISVEAWIAIDKTQEWGGILGAMQDNGSYERGWLLGFQHYNFFFAVSSQKIKRLTYLKASTQFQPGIWYHVVGTYDGEVMRLFVDGQMRAVSSEQSGPIEYAPKFHYTLGAYQDDDEFYPMNGRIESAALFDKTLSADAVTTRFNLRKAEFPGIEPVRPSVVGWPMAMRDTQRTSETQEELKFPLSLKWRYQARFPPRPAWPEEAKKDYYNRRTPQERVNYDKVFHVVGAGNRLYFGSSADDCVRCLDSGTGAERWSFCTEGPVRLAPTLDNGRIYFGSDDGCAYCLDAETGAQIWKQRVAPGERQIAGNERIVNAWPIRTDFFIENNIGHICSGLFAEQGVSASALDLRTGKLLEAQPLKTTAQGYQRRLWGKLVTGAGRNPNGTEVTKLQSEGKEIGPTEPISAEFRFSFARCGIAAGSAGTFIGGADGKLSAFDGRSGKEIWTVPTEGRPWSLAIFNGCLFASTDRGFIYCFSAEKIAQPNLIEPPAPERPSYANADKKRNTESSAAFIVSYAPLRRGYCLLLGGDAALALEIARRSDCRIVVRDNSAERIEAGRKVIEDAGVADRVSFQLGEMKSLPYADMLFDCAVDCGVFLSGEALTDAAELQRVIRPYGGTAIRTHDTAGIFHRPALNGAGEWTHQYANNGNTACSGDSLIRGPLDLQWFGPPGASRMIDRHHRTAAPLFFDGRLFVPGEDRIFGVNAYNGTVLWETPLTDSRRVVVFRDSSYLAAGPRGLCVALSDKCLLLDPATGKHTRDIPLPNARDHEWDYLAVEGDLLFGTSSSTGTIRREQSRTMTISETHWDLVPICGSGSLFATDLSKPDNATLWTYTPAKGLIVNPTLTIGGGAIYFVESENPKTTETVPSRFRLPDMFARGGTLKALDLKTGQVRWSKPVEGIEKSQHNIYAQYSNGLIALTASRNNGWDKKNSRVVYDIWVFDAKDGALKWSFEQVQATPIGGDHGEQDLHPAIVGGTIYVEPHAYELATGKPVAWLWPWMAKRRTGCGTLSASQSQLFFRDSTMTMFDLAAGKVGKVTLDTRPGCWINMIPAGGMLLAPEASSGCTCDFAVQTSLGLVPAKEKRARPQIEADERRLEK